MIKLGQGHLLTLAGLSSINTFQRFFSLKPLGQSKPNFIWSIYRKWEPMYIKIIQVTWPRWPPCPYMLKSLKYLLLQNRWTHFNETLHEVWVPQVLQCVNKSWPCGDLDLFYGKVNIGHQCIWMGKTFKMSFKVKVLQEMGSRTEY